MYNVVVLKLFDPSTFLCAGFLTLRVTWNILENSASICTELSKKLEKFGIWTEK